MTFQIKISKKPVEYTKALKFLERKVDRISLKLDQNDFIWILEHPHTFTGGINYNEKDIIDKSIDVIKTNRGGKITYHGPGQLIFYFVIDLKKRSKDIRKFVNLIENLIIETLKEYNINAYSDRKNVGIWIKKKKNLKKVGAIGIKIKKWIAYHGFSLNLNTDLKKYNKIIPCGIKDKKVDNLRFYKNLDQLSFKKKLIKNFIRSFKI